MIYKEIGEQIGKLVDQKYKENGSKIISERVYNRLEYSPSIKTIITDRDMLKVHIDIALKHGDKKMFMKLTKHLQEIN